MLASTDQPPPSQCRIVAKPPPTSQPPTAQMSLGPLPQTALSQLLSLGSVDQAPFQWSMTPCSPTAHASPPLPQTARSQVFPAVASGSRDHATPSQCWMAPHSPTIQTSFAAVPQIPRSEPAAGTVASTDQAVPSQWRTVPASPTTHASSGPALQTAISPTFSRPAGRLDCHHLLPSQCSTVWPATQFPPTAHTSFGPLPPMPLRGTCPLRKLDHVWPFQWRIMTSPIAQTSFAELPQTCMSDSGRVEWIDHALPSQCRITPPPPRGR